MNCFSRLGRAMSLCLLGLGLALPGWTMAASSLNDSAAREHLEDMERHGVLRDSYWAHAYWDRSRSAPTAEARVSDLRWALKFDPYLTSARWDLSGALLRERDPEFATQAIQAVSSCLDSFRAQQRIVLWTITIAALATAGALLALSFLAIARAIPSVAHGLRERLHFLPTEVRTGAIILTMFIPFVLVLTLPPSPAVLWCLVLGTVGTWSILKRRERQTCVAAAIAITLAPFALAAWTRVAQGAFPDSYLQSLWNGQLAAEDLHTNIAELPKPSETLHDPDYYATLALLDRRAGRYDAAQKHLERAVSLEPGSWAYRNNLGNIRLLRGDTDGALEAYAAAQSLAPAQPLIRLNQAQAWVGKMDFTQADNALTEAVRMGYRLPPLLTSDPHDVVVRDRTLAPALVWERLLRDQPPAGVLAWSDALRMAWAPILPLRPFWLTLPLWFALYYVSLSRTLPRVQSCSGCGTKVCRKCHYRVQRRSLCPDCYAIRREIQAPLKRQELMNARRRRRSHLEHAIALGASMLLPGAGFYLRRSYRAAFLSALATLTLLLIATAGVLWPDPVAALGRSPLSQRVAFPLVLVAALSALSIRAYLSRRPPDDDANMTPSEPLRTTREI